MMRMLKVFAVLLHYPDLDLQRHVGELQDVIRCESALSPATRHELEGFLALLQHQDLVALQADYVGLFDRSRSLSLHLFEHVHGESRDRGQAMVELQDAYHEAGFRIAVSELPDYLPLFLEYCSMLPDVDAIEWLERSGQLLQTLEARLVKRGSDYAVVFRALLEIAGLETVDPELRRRIGQESRDDTPEALDRVWREEPVTFGPGDGCSGPKTHTGQVVPVDISRLGGSQG